MSLEPIDPVGGELELLQRRYVLVEVLVPGDEKLPHLVDPVLIPITAVKDQLTISVLIHRKLTLALRIKRRRGMWLGKMWRWHLWSRNNRTKSIDFVLRFI